MTTDKTHATSPEMEEALRKAVAHWNRENPGVEPTRSDLEALLAVYYFFPGGLQKPQLARIGETDLPVITYRGQRVVTLAMIDRVHKRPSGTARRNFNQHLRHFIVDEDFFEADQADEIRTLGLARPQGGTAEKVILLTEGGYLMLVKPLKDDLAWAVQRQMVNSYFASRQSREELERQRQEREEELSELRETNRRLRAIALAFHPTANRIARLQEAGVGPLEMPAYLRRSAQQTDDLITTLEDIGVLRFEDWVAEKRWGRPERWRRRRAEAAPGTSEDGAEIEQTPVEAAAAQMAMAFPEA